MLSIKKWDKRGSIYILIKVDGKKIKQFKTKKK